MFVWVLADVVGREGAEWGDRASAVAKVGEHAGHQAVGHALAAEAWVGLDVGHDEDVTAERIVGDRHDVVVDDQLVAAALGIVANRVLHARSVPPKQAPGVALTP